MTRKHPAPWVQDTSNKGVEGRQGRGWHEDEEGRVRLIRECERKK